MSNKYRDHLSKDRQSKPLSFLDPIFGVVKTAATIAGVGIGAYGAYKGLKATNAIEHLIGSKTFNTAASAMRNSFYEAKAYKKALGSTIQETSISRFLSGASDDVLHANLQQTMKSVAEVKNTGLGSTETAFEKLMMETKTSLSHTYQLSIHENRIKDMKNGLNDLGIGKESKDFISAILNNRKTALELSSETLKKTDNASDAFHEALIRVAEQNGLDISKAGNQANTDFKRFADTVGSKVVKEADDYFAVNKDNVNKTLRQHKENIYQGFYDMLEKLDSNTSWAMGKLGAQKYTVQDMLNNPINKIGRDNSKHMMKESLGSHHTINTLGKEEFTDTVDFAETILIDMKKVLGEKKVRDIRNFGADTAIFKNRQGAPVDLRFIGEAKDSFFTGLGNSFQVPIIKIRPFQTLGLFNKVSPARRDFYSTFAHDSGMPTIAKQLNDDYYMFGNKLFNSSGGLERSKVQVVDKKGPIAKGLSAMAGESRHREDNRNPIFKFLDLGRQEENSIFSRLMSTIHKGQDVRNPVTLINLLEEKKLAPSGELTPFLYKQISEITDKGTKALDSKTFKILSDSIVANPDVGGSVNDIIARFAKDQSENGILDTIDAIYKLNNGYKSKYINPRIILSNYKNSPTTYNVEKHLRDVQLELLNMSSQGGFSLNQTADSLLYENKIGLRQVSAIQDMGAFMSVKQAGMFAKPESTLNIEQLKELGNLFTNTESNAFKSIKKMAYSQSSILDEGVLPNRSDAFQGNRHILVGEHRSLIQNINEGIKDGIGPIETTNKVIADGVFNQWWAGRSDMSKVTKSTIIPYYYGFRLNEGLGWASLGLSSESMGSATDIAKNLYLKRILAPAAIITGAAYLNYEVGNITGEPSDHLANIYTGTSLNIQRLKDITGINAFSQRIQKVAPGIDKFLFGNPFGMAAGTLSAGLIGEDRGYDTLKYEYEKGFKEVRKGRYWSFGSDTPFYGGRIEFNEVPLYRKIIGEPENTDVLYGSEAEKWGHSWLPNPRNPLGILRNVLDPYWLDRKHFNDRPYPITGGIPELETVPIVGPLVQGTIGRIIKPGIKRSDLSKTHREYLRDINETIKDKQGGGNSFIKITSGGTISPVEVNLPEGFSDGVTDDNEEATYSGNGFAPSGQSVTEGVGSLTGKGRGQAIDNGLAYLDLAGAQISTGSGSGAQTTRARLQAINTGIISGNATRQGSNNSISSLRNAEYIANLDTAMDPNSTAYRLSETYYSMSEIGGIYGFLSQSLFGEMAPETTLASSDRMDSPQRRWWDKRMGGMGSEISEIYRRFLPNQRNSIDRYNPYKNQMPDWMPGLEYMLDFKHGDPFCVSKDTLIDTDKGFIKAVDVNIGDMILTHKGNRLPIKNKMVRPILQNEKSYSISIANIDGKVPLEFSEGHPLLVKKLEKCSHASSSICRPSIKNYNKFCDNRTCKNKWNDAQIEFMETKDVKIGDAVVYKIPVILNPINKINYSYKWNEAPRSETLAIKDFMNLNKETAWLLGLYCAEGSTAKKNNKSMRLIFSFHKEEIEVIEKVSDILYNLSGKKPTLKTRNNNTDIILNDAKMARIFNSIIPGNLYEKRIPKELYMTSHDIKLSFILGFMLGDGTIQRNYLIGTTANKLFAQDLHKLCFECGIPAAYIERNTRIAFEVAIHAFHLRNKNTEELLYKNEYLPKEFSRQPGLLSWTDDEYIYSLITDKKEIFLKEVYGFEVEIDDSFCVFGFATHNTKVPQGESLLPGAGYEATNELHGDPFFGKYGALDRMKILGNVAPWSEQYKYYSKASSLLHSKGYISDEDYEEAAYTRKMASARKKPFDLYPYKFKYADEIKKQKVTITRMIDDTTFLTKEMPDSPIRLAGAKAPAKDTEEGDAVRAYLATILKAGNQITIGLNTDPMNQEQADVLQTQRAVVYDMWGDPIQKKMVALGAKGDYADNSAVTTNALFSGTEIAVGKMWEGFSHLDTPFHTKFFQVRSPLEHYKRTFLYGKEFKSWSNPIQDWVIPTVENAATWNPLVAGMFGAAMGSLAGIGKPARLASMAIGAAIAAIPATVRTGSEIAHFLMGNAANSAFIPERRQHQRDIDEYIDKLKYIKYKGLYEKASRMAEMHEGVNPKSIADFADKRGILPKQIKSKLQEIKRQLKLGMSDESGMDKEEAKEKLDLINAELEKGGQEGILAQVGPYTAQALQYKKEYESTLYGADPKGDLMSIYRGMPKKDRPFMQHFMTASPEEREEILRLVPKNQRRFYQSKWGLKTDERESLGKYFQSNYLPGPDWKGWRPDVSLEAVKLKIAKNEAMDIRDMGFYEQDERQAENAPEISRKSINLDVSKLSRALSGAGLKDTDVTISFDKTDNPNEPIGIDMNIAYDRRYDAKKAIEEHAQNLLN